jgi:hypothetical protein
MPAAQEASLASATPSLDARGAIGESVDAPLAVQLSPRDRRPRLQVMRRAAGVADAAAPALVRATAVPATQAAPAHRPVPATSTAQALARATAGAIAYEDDGRMSVLFPPPGAVTVPLGPVLARDESEAPPPPPPPAATAEPAPTAAPPALDREDLYQEFMRRLRRDVLEQREQIGELY